MAMEGSTFKLLAEIERLRAMARGYFNIVACRQVNVEAELIQHSRRVRTIMENCMSLAKDLDANDKSKKPTEAGFKSMSAATKRVSRDVAHSLASETKWRITAKGRARSCSEAFTSTRAKKYPRRIDESLQASGFSNRLQEIKGGFTFSEEKFEDGRMRQLTFKWEPADLGPMWAVFSFYKKYTGSDAIQAASPLAHVDLDDLRISDDPMKDSTCSLFVSLKKRALKRCLKLASEATMEEAVVDTVSWLSAIFSGSLRQRIKWKTVNTFSVEPE